MRRRRPGRPSRRALDRERILRRALGMLERDGLTAVTMRALARELAVDPMALYHYYADRDALLADAAALVYRSFEAPRVRGTWDKALVALAERYLQLLAGTGELLRYVTAHERAAAIPTEVFDAHLAAVLAPLGLGPRALRTSTDVVVDFVHGFALGVSRSGPTPKLERRFRAELAVVAAGISALRSP